jgi:hypothetical protein
MKLNFIFVHYFVEVFLHRVEHLLAVVLRACAGDQPGSARSSNKREEMTHFDIELTNDNLEFERWAGGTHRIRYHAL